MRSSKSLFSWIAAGALLALFVGCNEDSPAKPAPNRDGDGTTAFSATSTSSPGYTPTFNSNTQPVMDNVAGQSQVVKGAVEALELANELVAQLTALLAELQAEAPQKADGEPDEAFQKRLAAHQQKVAAAQQQLAQAQAAVQKALVAVDAAQKELQKMQSSDLPSAQRKDAQEMERYFEEEKKKLEAAAEQVASASEATNKDTDTDESADQSETKPTLNKTPVLSPFKASTSTNTGLKAASDPKLSGGSTPSSGLPTD